MTIVLYKFTFTITITITHHCAVMYVCQCVCLSVCVSVYLSVSLYVIMSLCVCSEDLLKDSFAVMGDEGDGRESWSDRPHSSVKFDVDDTVDERHAKVCLVSILL